jgi:hypothetical protein
MTLPARPEGAPEHVAAYKRVLQEVLDNRPSGMRQRLAEALGKNRSFISQISNPAYPTPIPVQHVESIFQLCHFSPKEREAFLSAYRRAHPRRLQLHRERERVRRVTLALPDLGDEAKNRRLETMLAEMAEQLAQLLRGR